MEARKSSLVLAHIIQEITMANSFDNKMILFSAAAAAIVIIRRRRRRRESLQGRMWSREWLARRSSDRGIGNFVLNELMIPGAGGFHSFLRMTPDQFRELLHDVEPVIERSDTVTVLQAMKCSF